MLKRLREILGMTPPVPAPEEPQFDPELFIYVMIPAPIQPIDRGTQFEDPIEARLQAEGLGTVSGGGSQLSVPDAEGRKTIEFCGLDIDVVDRERALELLRNVLPTLRSPFGTELWYIVDGRRRLDRSTEHGWILDQERTALHPGFDL